MGKRHKSYDYKFTEKSHSHRGIAALLTSLCSLGAGVGIVFWSFRQEGEGGEALAMCGIASLLAALVSFGMAVSGIRQEDRYRLFPVLGLVFSLVALAAWVGLYALGFLA